MNYISQLAKEHSRANTDKIAKAIGNDADKFKKIIEIIYKEKAPLPQRASWLLHLISRSHPELVKPYIKKFIDSVQDFKVDGIKRGMMMALSHQTIPEKLQAKTIDVCFAQMLSPDETVAVKVWAMQTACNIVVLHPELKNELKAIIDDQLPKNTIAFSSRAKKILKSLETPKLKK